jgi:hypothetical protein
MWSTSLPQVQRAPSPGIEEKEEKKMGGFPKIAES